jgi:perosamine synthetase
MKIPYFIPTLTNSDKSKVLSVLNSRWLTNGPMLEKFEKKINQFIGTKYALGVGSGTQALHLSLRSLDIGPGDEVIVPTLTFAATANAVIYCGATPVFADVQSDSFNIDPKSISQKINKKTKAIIPVHYGGQACDMDKIISISKKHNLFIVEDCAHALGSTFKKKYCGNIGDIGCYSFYPTKIITTGEGGMLVTNNKKLHDRNRIFRSQGMNIMPNQREKQHKWKYDIVDLGYNYRMDEIGAALGFSQSKRIKTINNQRVRIAKKYNEQIKKIKNISIPEIKPNRNHIFHLYTIKVEKNYHLTRDQLFLKLHKLGIGTSVQYYPLHLMSYYKKNLTLNLSNFPVSNDLSDKILSLPIYPEMTEKQIEYIVDKL